MIREEPGGGQEGKQGRIMGDNIKTGEEQGQHREKHEEPAEKSVEDRGDNMGNQGRT